MRARMAHPSPLFCLGALVMLAACSRSASIGELQAQNRSLLTSHRDGIVAGSGRERGIPGMHYGQFGGPPRTGRSG